MPPTATSSALVPVGARHVATSNRQSKRDENGDKPSTARALILRNGKHGARGTGELVPTFSKLLGREKFDLLYGTFPHPTHKLDANLYHAEDLDKKSQTAILNPFRLDTSLKIADSQCSCMPDVSFFLSLR